MMDCLYLAAVCAMVAVTAICVAAIALGTWMLVFG